MSNIQISLTDNGQCAVTHKESGASVSTSRPPEYGGKGDSFSGTDLLAAALGACMATSLQKVGLTDSLPIDQFELNVEKKLSESPKMISSLKVSIRCKQPLSSDQIQTYDAAARSCPVYKSLSKDLEVNISFVSPK